NIFIIGFVIVLGLSWIINKIMTKMVAFEQATQTFPILEDVYIGNVESFEKRLTRRTYIEIITTIYFSIATLVIAIAVLKFRVNDWLALIVFVVLTIITFYRSFNLIKATSKLKENPTTEQCIKIANETYKLDHNSYSETRNNATYEDTFPPKPYFFYAIIIVSAVIALISLLLGLCLGIIEGIVLLTFQTPAEEIAPAGIYFLYGSLATYFGIKDLIACFHSY
ncbi:MAG: hypothetical protein K2H32_10160, partial [Muribaculaceae bacterium]|nr:hypothetical protein [Muribaculaceae bacterium]